jgi:hypothetical protein
MDAFAMQNDRPSCRTNVRELPVVRLGHPNRAVPNDDRFSSLRVIAYRLHLPRVSWPYASC